MVFDDPHRAIDRNGGRLTRPLIYVICFCAECMKVKRQDLALKGSEANGGNKDDLQRESKIFLLWVREASSMSDARNGFYFPHGGFFTVATGKEVGCSPEPERIRYYEWRVDLLRKLQQAKEKVLRFHTPPPAPQKSQLPDAHSCRCCVNFQSPMTGRRPTVHTPFEPRSIRGLA